MFKENLVVSVKAGGNYLTDKGNRVLMPFGTEYELFFRNKDCRRVAIGPVTIDGKDVLNGKRLVLDAGDDSTIKGEIRNTDDSYNFKFIEKTKKISDHRGDDPEDGLISVAFQYEEIQRRFSKSPFTLDRRVSVNSSIGGNIGCHSTMDACATYSAVSNYSSPEPQAEAGITVNGSKMSHSYSLTSLGRMEEEKHNLIFGLYGYTEKGEHISEAVTPKTKLICGTCNAKWAYTQKFCGECGTNLH